jgi:beta-glucosidase
MSEKIKFPDGFLWGTATSGYQIEGGNFNTDWSEWEKKGKTNETCGQACDYWNRWKNDHALLSELGVNVFRFSIEWARIEPEEGKFSDEAIEKYREILKDLRTKNIKTQVTLWHWVSPDWFSKKYGFHKRSSREKFERYVSRVVEELGEFIDIYVVFNEPMVPLGMGYLTGKFPPGFKNPWKFWQAANNLAKSHCKAYEIIHKKYPESQVGITYLYNWYSVDGLGFFEKIANKVSKWYRIDFFGNKIKDFQDFIGIDYYRLGKIIYDRKNSMHLGFRIEEDEENPMRWITYADGMYLVLKEAYEKYQKPIYITENGTPTNKGIEDDGRIDFIKTHLKQVHRAMKEGIPILGYNYWSLMDNYEWLEGFRPRFGLVEIDFSTFERKPRKSLYEYAKICKNNELEIE